MAFLLNDQFVPPSDDGDDASFRRLRHLLEHGSPEDQKAALVQLVARRAETVLLDCLQSENITTVELGTFGLWECWLNEAGPDARREMDQGIAQMEAGALVEALAVFARLVEKHPDWAEAHNKQATVLYLLGNARLGLRVCRTVVKLKPIHFGAWNGMALCAAQLERWPEALAAAKKGLALQPGAQANRDLIQIAEAKLREGA
jgi:Flp pilus assembly protein TadD